MNDFDRRMMEISRAFGSRGAFAAAIVAFVERTPALWQRIEAERSKLGEVARLRYLNQALAQRLAVGRGSDAEIVARLNTLPIEQRTLLAMEFFNTSSRTAASTSSSSTPQAPSPRRSTMRSAKWVCNAKRQSTSAA